MENQHIKRSVVDSLFWKILERAGTQGIQFVVQIVLARLLLPEDYGVVAIIAVFMIFSRVFVESGFSMALVQKKDSDDTDFSSVFFLTLGISLLVYILLYFSAPIISNFYNLPILVPAIRILSINIPLGSMNAVQNAFITKHMLFKKLFKVSVVSISISGIIGIVMAYIGFGVWALISQQIINLLLITAILWFSISWKPRLEFSFYRVKKLFSFGWKLLASSLIDSLYNEMRSLVIGKIFNPAILGFYTRGKQFPSTIVVNLNGSIQSVMLPTLSQHQNDIKAVKSIVRRSIVTSAFLIFPMMVGLAIIAEPLVNLVLTEKWLPSVPFLQIYCFTFALWPIHTANLQAINALGRSDIFLKLELIKKGIGVLILIISIQFGIYAIAIGGAIGGIINSFINAYPNKKLLGYSFNEQLKDIMPSLVISVCMGILTHFIYISNIGVTLNILVKIVSGVAIYLALAVSLKIEAFNYLLVSIKQIKKSK